MTTKEFEKFLRSVDELPEDEDLELEEEEEEDMTDVYDLLEEIERYEYQRNVLADELGYWRRHGH